MDALHALEEMKHFLAALKIPISGETQRITHAVEVEMTLEDHIDFLNKTEKSTASSPSGIHYGHFKAVCESALLGKVNLFFMTLLFKAGIPLS